MNDIISKKFQRFIVYKSPIFNGMQHVIIKFPNNYGASVIINGSDVSELALLEFLNDSKTNGPYSIKYGTNDYKSQLLASRTIENKLKQIFDFESDGKNEAI